MPLTASEAQGKEKITAKINRTIHGEAVVICKEKSYPKLNLTDYIDLAIKEKNERMNKAMEDGL